jgi:hypothetical protein
MQKLGPLSRSIEVPCATCRQRFVLGDFLAVIPLQSQRANKTSEMYDPITALVHWHCADVVSKES